jgi:DNA-directed RNA polymerase subunit K/omega
MSTPIKNQFEAIIVASARARELKAQARRDNTDMQSPVVQAYQEVQSGKIGRDYLDLFKSR